MDALGTLRLLESIRQAGLTNKTKFYQASSSELYGLVKKEIPQNELTPFHPRSPYAVSKLFSYWITVNYRESYGMFACNGILFNHESPRRGETFVTKKITRGLSRIAYGLEKILKIGNLEAKRDWGHARDYVELQWKILQQEKPDDFVIATGQQVSVRDFINLSLEKLELKVNWEGSGKNERAVVSKFNINITPKIKKGDIIIAVDEKYFRPAEVDTLLGNSDKAQKLLNWKPSITLEEMVTEMIDTDLKEAKSASLVSQI